MFVILFFLSVPLFVRFVALFSPDPLADMLNLYQLLVNADGFPACAFFSPHPIMNSDA